MRLPRRRVQYLAWSLCMRNRAAKFGPALIASFLATASFIPMSYGETPAADECLSAPKPDTPAGGHWHFRIEHPSNRHCWYLRSENASAPKTATRQPPVLTNAETPTS